MRLILWRGAAVLIGLAIALGPAAGPAVAAPTKAEDDAWPVLGLVLEDQTLEVPAPGVLGNDTVDAGTKCVTGFDTTGLQGSLDAGVAEDGSFSFTPFADWNGETTFTYDMAGYTSGSCPEAVESTATVTITVTAVNDAPTAVLVETCDGGVTVGEDSGAFSDPAHCVELHNWGPVDEVTQQLEAWVVSSNHPELFSVAPSISIFETTFGRLHFTPAPNANGSATVTVRGRDSGGTANGGVDLSPALQFTLTITAVNDAPTATADSFIVLKDRTLNVGVPGVLINDGDIDSGTITAVLVTPPGHGVLTLAANGSFSYTPATGFEGLDFFSYRAFDGSASSPARVVSLTVTAIPPVPTPTPILTPTPLPTETLTPFVTPEPSAGEPSPSASAETSASLDPGASPAQSVSPSAAVATPAASASPTPTGEGGGVSMPVLLVLVLFVLLLGFGAALYVPKWLKAQGIDPSRRGEPD